MYPSDLIVIIEMDICKNPLLPTTTLPTLHYEGRGGEEQGVWVERQKAVQKVTINNKYIQLVVMEWELEWMSVDNKV